MQRNKSLYSQLQNKTNVFLYKIRWLYPATKAFLFCFLFPFPSCPLQTNYASPRPVFSSSGCRFFFFFFLNRKFKCPPFFFFFEGKTHKKMKKNVRYGSSFFFFFCLFHFFYVFFVCVCVCLPLCIIHHVLMYICEPPRKYTHVRVSRMIRKRRNPKKNREMVSGVVRIWRATLRWKRNSSFVFSFPRWPSDTWWLVLFCCSQFF